MNARLIDGEMVTVEDLIKKHGALIWRLVGKYKRQRLSGIMDWDDLRSIVHEALIIAFKNYDPDKGTKFTTLFSIWVKNRMQEEIISSEMLYVPEAPHRYAEKIRANDDVHLSASELVKKYGCGLPTAKALEQYFYFSFRSIHSTVDSEDEDMSVEEVLGKMTDHSSMIVHDFLSTLTEDQLLLLSWREKDLTYHEIGKLLGITRQAANLQIKKIRMAWEAFEADELSIVESN